MHFIRTVGELKKYIASLPDETPLARAIQIRLIQAHFVDGDFAGYCYSIGDDKRNCCTRPNYPNDKRITVISIS